MRSSNRSWRRLMSAMRSSAKPHSVRTAARCSSVCCRSPCWTAHSQRQQLAWKAVSAGMRTTCARCAHRCQVLLYVLPQPLFDAQPIRMKQSIPLQGVGR